jgi:hypothetical protein
VPPGVYRTFRNLTDGEARLLVLIQGDEKMSDKIEMPRRIGEEVRQKHGDRVMELLAGINMRFQGGEAKDITPEQMQSRIGRAAHLEPRAGAQETVFPLMAPQAGGAPVQAWPGLSVALLQPRAGEASTATVDGEHAQWVINIGDTACEVVVDGRTTVLGRYDLVRVEPGTTRTVRGSTGQAGRILLATQGRETISAQAIQ